MPRKKAARLPMKAVAKVADAPNPNQLALDFEGRAAEAQKTKARAKAPRLKKAPTGTDIPEKPSGNV